MFKIIATLTAAFLISAVTFATAADAGCGGRKGFHNYQSSVSAKRTAQLRAKKAAQARAAAAAQKRKQQQIAKAKKAAAQAEVAEAAPKVDTEALATTAEIAKDASEVTVATVPATCSKFIPATGGTISIPCSQE